MMEAQAINITLSVILTKRSMIRGHFTDNFERPAVFLESEARKIGSQWIIGNLRWDHCWWREFKI